jgi:hypothetical protein
LGSENLSHFRVWFSYGLDDRGAALRSCPPIGLSLDGPYRLAGMQGRSLGRANLHASHRRGTPDPLAITGPDRADGPCLLVGWRPGHPGRLDSVLSAAPAAISTPHEERGAVAAHAADAAAAAGAAAKL